MAEGRGGVVKKFLDHTTPSARAQVASQLFLIAQPPPPPAEREEEEPVAARLFVRSVPAGGKSGESMLVGKDHQFLTVFKPELCEHGTEMMSHCLV